ncbi:carbohydrate-binding module family 13 protein, partial [Suillus bovinus]|uniref:carbohydrate-binding module family 13 protein n=1 Tax=Suillus bovinus TaxID=48563 RepID=UPI001B86D079
MSSIQNQHTYTLRNCAGGTVMDLSGRDKYSIIGFNNNNGTNQAWIFQENDDGWFIKSVYNDRYLGIEVDPAHGTRLVAGPSPCKWDIRDSDVQGFEGIRILLHGQTLSVELSDYGNAKGGTPIRLAISWHGSNQIW